MGTKSIKEFKKMFRGKEANIEEIAENKRGHFAVNAVKAAKQLLKERGKQNLNRKERIEARTISKFPK